MSDIDTALSQFAARAGRYKEYRDYYAGNHRLAFATDKFRNAFGPLFSAFADNLCPTIVDAVADRLIIEGFISEGAARARERRPRVPGQQEPPDPTADAAWEVWEANRMDRRAGEAHQEALRCGDSYVIVWPGDDGEPTLYPQKAAQMNVVYDEEHPGVLLWAAKCWPQPDGRMRLTLYYPDRLEKFVTRKDTGGTMPSKASDFIAFAPDVPNPYDQVPVFHLAANAGIGEYGRSELADIIPLQDALNKSVCDMLVGMEFTALPQRWITGLTVEKDELTGRPIAPFVPGVDRVWAVGDKDIHFGEFAPAGLDNYLHVQDNLRLEMARVSRTPMHYMLLGSGRWPSGEALRIADTPLVNKCQDRMSTFGEAWGDAFTFALRIKGIPGSVTPEWADPHPHSELEFRQGLLAEQQMGVPLPFLWAKLGYSDADIAVMLSMAGSAPYTVQSGQAQPNGSAEAQPPAPPSIDDTQPVLA